jgi:hypothetical protein
LFVQGLSGSLFALVCPMGSALLLLAFIAYVGGAKPSRSSISIRGYEKPQQLPLTHMKHWDVFTYNFKELKLIENEISHEGWVHPTSIDSLYLPADLPTPVIEPALGIVLIHGSARYIMPSVITTLTTPDRTWRNRGICSLPRSFAWIDLFAPFTPSISDLKYSLFEKVTSDVRFLEDQDGTTAWQSMIDLSNERDKTIKGLFRPIDISTEDDRYCVNIDETLKRFQDELIRNPLLNELKNEGFRIIDIPLPYSFNPSLLQLRGQRMKAFITDFLEPERLLEVEDETMLENEPCGELDIALVPAGKGKTSKFLPAVYKELYEDGAVLYS